MTALYWPDLDCTTAARSIGHELTVHDHYSEEQAACRAFIAYRAATTCYPPPDLRYRCIRGPRGILRGVEHKGMRLRGFDELGREIWAPSKERPR